MNPSAFRDFYALLKLQPGAEPREILRAVRKARFRWHPDRNPHEASLAQERFRAIQEARDVLLDPAKRAVYDARWWRERGSRSRPPEQRARARQDLSSVVGAATLHRHERAAKPLITEIFAADRAHRRSRAKVALGLVWLGLSWMLARGMLVITDPLGSDRLWWMATYLLLLCGPPSLWLARQLLRP